MEGRQEGQPKKKRVARGVRCNAHLLILRWRGLAHSLFESTHSPSLTHKRRNEDREPRVRLAPGEGKTGFCNPLLLYVYAFRFENRPALTACQLDRHPKTLLQFPSGPVYEYKSPVPTLCVCLARVRFTFQHLHNGFLFFSLSRLFDIFRY